MAEHKIGFHCKSKVVCFFQVLPSITSNQVILKPVDDTGSQHQFREVDFLLINQTFL